MKKIIHRMRNQPEETRRHMLHLLTLIAAIILFFIWIYTLGVNFGNPDTQAKMSNDLKPLSALKDNLVGGYQNISNGSPDTQQ